MNDISEATDAQAVVDESVAAARARWAQVVPQRRYRLAPKHPPRQDRPTERTYWTAPTALYDPTGTFRVCECGRPLLRTVRADGVAGRYPVRCRACRPAWNEKFKAAYARRSEGP